jgi:hypothetical protein
VNPYKFTARRKKAAALLSALRTLPDFPGRDEMETWSPESWCILATIAGVNKPSVDTQRLVVEMARAS